MALVVVLPIIKAEKPLEDKIKLFKDKDGKLRVAMGLSKGDPSSDAASLVEKAFGTHGFVNCIGETHMNGESIYFYSMGVRSVLSKGQHSADLTPIEVSMSDAIQHLTNRAVSMNIFLNMALRMQAEQRGLYGKKD